MISNEKRETISLSSSATFLPLLIALRTAIAEILGRDPWSEWCALVDGYPRWTKVSLAGAVVGSVGGTNILLAFQSHEKV